MRHNPRESAKVLPFTGKIERPPEQVLELKRQELDGFAERMIERWSPRLFSHEQFKRMAALKNIDAQYSLEETEQYLTRLRNDRSESHMGFMELAYADAYLRKRKGIAKKPDGKN